MLRFISIYSGIDWNFLALAVAGGLFYALVMLLIRPEWPPQGHREVRDNGCVTATWHDPVTGRDETAPGWPRC